MPCSDGESSPLRHSLRLAANSPETAAFAGARGYAVFVASVINRFPKLPEQIDIYRRAFQATRHTGKRSNVAAIFPVYMAGSTAHIRHEVEASLMYYFRAVTEQLRLGERDPSPSYGYLREVRRRMEAITWEGGRGDHGAVRLPRTVCAETPGGARAVWDGSDDLLV